MLRIIPVSETCDEFSGENGRGSNEAIYGPGIPKLDTTLFPHFGFSFRNGATVEYVGISGAVERVGSLKTAEDVEKSEVVEEIGTQVAAREAILTVY